MKILDWVLIGIITTAVVMAIVYLVRNRGKGCGSCTGCNDKNCESCKKQKE